MAYSQAECVYILEHYVASKLFAAVPEAFTNACPDKEVPDKTIHQLLTQFRGAGSVRSYRFQAARQLQEWDTAAGIQYCRREGVHL
jgi:hypothetical protein